MITEKVPWTDSPNWSGSLEQKTSFQSGVEREYGRFLNKEDLKFLKNSQILSQFSSFASLGFSFATFSEAMKSHWVRCGHLHSVLRAMGEVSGSGSGYDSWIELRQSVYEEFHIRLMNIDGMTAHLEWDDVQRMNALFVSLIAFPFDGELDTNSGYLTMAIEKVGIERVIELARLRISPSLMLEELLDNLDSDLIESVVRGP